jgi:hypothetical protein
MKELESIAVNTTGKTKKVSGFEGVSINLLIPQKELEFTKTLGTGAFGTGFL